MKDTRPNLETMRALAHLLDTKFQGPYGIRFGLDGLLGLIPGIGDFVTSALSMLIIAHAASLGVNTSTLIRMTINVMLENVVGAIPILGNLFDFYWKANVKNLELIEGHFLNPTRETIKSRTIVALVGIALFSLLIFSLYISWRILVTVYDWIVFTLPPLN
jgi:hypothetical protein